MSIFAIIANIINKILSFGLLSGFTGSSQSDRDTGSIVGGALGGSVTPGPSQQATGHCLITIPEVVNAHFFDTGSSAWKDQHILAEDGKTYDSIHGGTDYGAPTGSTVYAGKALSNITLGHYSDSGRYGDYIIGTTDDGIEYYSGHLQNVVVHNGDNVPCGGKLGEIGIYNHTHIQLKRGNVYLDPEKYLQ